MALCHPPSMLVNVVGDLKWRSIAPLPEACRFGARIVVVFSYGAVILHTFSKNNNPMLLLLQYYYLNWYISIYY